MAEAERLIQALQKAVQMEDAEDDAVLVARWFVEDSAKELRRLSAVNEQLTSINEELVEIAKSVEGIISNCDISSGICCCGDSMEGHPDPINCGHTPVDSGWYAADSLFQKTKAALEKAK